MNGITIGKAINLFVQTMEERQQRGEISAEYVRVSTSRLNHFQEAYAGRAVGSISRRTVDGYFAERAESLAAATFRKYRMTHRQLWAFCVAQGWIEEDISQPAPEPEPKPPRPDSVAAAVEDYLKEQYIGGASEFHLNSLRSRLGQFVDAYGERDLASITEIDVHEHFRSLAARDLAEATMASYAASHRAFWTWLAEEEGEIEESPARRLKRWSFDPAGPKAVPKDHLQAVLDALPAFVEHRGRNPRDVRDALCVSLAIDSGVRLGELAGLRRAAVEKALKRGAASGVYTAGSKGKTGGAAVRFSEATAQLFRLWFAVAEEELPAGEDGGRVFLSTRTGRPITRNALSVSAFERVCEFAGVPTFRSHAIRHRNIMDITRQLDIRAAQRYAGHRHVSTTAAYIDANDELGQEAAATLAGRRRSANPAEVDAMAQLFGVAE